MPKPPSGGGGGNNNACNSLCRAIAANLQLRNDLNAAGLNVELELNYDETPNNPIIIKVTAVNLQNCTIRGTEVLTGATKIVTCSFVFNNYIDMQLN
ncbi:hypothetical protein bcgnr5376_55920 [Bacillus cereus]